MLERFCIINKSEAAGLSSDLTQFIYLLSRATLANHKGGGLKTFCKVARYPSLVANIFFERNIKGGKRFKKSKVLIPFQNSF